MGMPTGPAVRIEGLAEVVLGVRDVGVSLAFYRDLLGLAVVSPPGAPGPIFLRAGAATAGLPAWVVLVPLPADAPPFTSPSPLHHLALAIRADSTDEAATRLEQAGHAVRRGRHPLLGATTLYLQDPDGNEVELIATPV